MTLQGDEAAEANEPLISQRGDLTQDSSSDTDDRNEDASIKISMRNAGTVVHFLTLSAGISGLLFGFDTGVISSTLVSIGNDLSNRPLTLYDQSIVTAVTSLSALLSAPTTGFFADRYGRKSVILFPALLFILGAIIQAAANAVWTMVLGRALVGVAVGVASGAVPLYITELAPAELRGRLVTTQSLFVTGGQVVAYLLGWLLSTKAHGWRYMVGAGAVPALVQLVLLPWMPETPRWLLRVGQEQDASRVLQQVYRNLPEHDRDSMVAQILSNISAEIISEDKVRNRNVEEASVSRSTLKELVHHPGNRRALTLACMLQGLQQLCGFNSLMYFSAVIFAMVGFNSPITASLSVALTNFVFTLLAFAYIDTVGRRKILLRSIPFMTIGLLACSVAFFQLDTRQEGTRLLVKSSQGSWAVVLLVSMIIYVASYAVGLGCVPWQQSELFPLQVRSLGSGLATATNWSSNFVIGITFLPMMNFLGLPITFACYAVICFLGWLCIYNIYPETAGLPIEKIGELLKHGWSVEESVRTFNERRRRR